MQAYPYYGFMLSFYDYETFCCGGCKVLERSFLKKSAQKAQPASEEDGFQCCELFSCGEYECGSCRSKTAQNFQKSRNIGVGVKFWNALYYEKAFENVNRLHFSSSIFLSQF